MDCWEGKQKTLLSCQQINENYCLAGSTRSNNCQTRVEDSLTAIIHLYEHRVVHWNHDCDVPDSV